MARLQDLFPRHGGKIVRRVRFHQPFMSNNVHRRWCLPMLPTHTSIWEQSLLGIQQVSQIQPSCVLRSKSLASLTTPFSLLDRIFSLLPSKYVFRIQSHFKTFTLSLVQVTLILCPDLCCGLLTGLSTSIFSSFSLFSTLQTQWETVTTLCCYMHGPKLSTVSHFTQSESQSHYIKKQFYLSNIINFILATLYNYIRRKQMLNANNGYLLTLFKLAFTLFIWKNYFLYTSVHCTLSVNIYLWSTTFIY